MTTLKTSLRYIFRFFLGMIAFILLYLLFAFLSPYVKVNSSFQNAAVLASLNIAEEMILLKRRAQAELEKLQKTQPRGRWCAIL